MTNFNCNLGILLVSDFENAITIIGIIFMMIGFVVLFHWVSAKFFGVYIHGKYQHHAAINKIDQDKQLLMLQKQEDIEEAIRRCARKGFAKTHSNVLTEVRKINRQRENNTISDNIKKGFVGIKENAVEIVSKIGKDKYDQLEKLGRLKEKGLISSDEFEQEKRKILGNFDSIN